MSFGAPPCPSPAEPGWRRTLSKSEVDARYEALRLAQMSNSMADHRPEAIVARAEAYRAFLMGETK